MARGLNKVTLIGNLGDDPDVRYTRSGSSVTNVRLATNEQWKDKSGDSQSRTEWHTVVFFGKLGEIAGEYLTKGSLVYVEGRLQTDKWKDRDGNDRWTTKVIGNQMLMLGGGNGRSSSNRDEDYNQDRAPRSDTPPDDDFDDDIPF